MCPPESVTSEAISIRVDFSELRQDVAAIKEDVQEIRAQTTKTNGRVSKLEVAREVDEAIRAERASVIAHTQQRRAWVPGGGVAVACVLLGYGLQHFVG